jgi:hypothetical protein
MAAGLCYGSRGGGAALAFHHQVGAYDTDTLIGALEGLRRFLSEQKATLVVEPLWASLKGVELANLARREPKRMSWRRPSVASSASVTPTTWPSRSCATAACRCGEQRPRHRTEGTAQIADPHVGGLAGARACGHARRGPAAESVIGGSQAVGGSRRSRNRSARAYLQTDDEKPVVIARPRLTLRSSSASPAGSPTRSRFPAAVPRMLPEGRTSFLVGKPALAVPARRHSKSEAATTPPTTHPRRCGHTRDRTSSHQRRCSRIGRVWRRRQRVT